MHNTFNTSRFYSIFLWNMILGKYIVHNVDA